MGIMDWLGFITGVICVALIVIEKDSNWPIGVLNSIILLYVFYTQKLWATVGLQTFYTFECLYGWWMWTRRDKLTGFKLIRIGNTPLGMFAALTVLCVLGVAILYPILRYYEDPYPFWDAVVGVVSLAAEYLLCLKMRQAWTVYFCCDLVSMIILGLLGAWVTFGTYAVFTLLCVAGIFEWKRRFLNLQRDVIPLKETVCAGCGQNELHKMCPAHGTDVYMNPTHPDWGKNV